MRNPLLVNWAILLSQQPFFVHACCAWWCETRCYYFLELAADSRLNNNKKKNNNNNNNNDDDENKETTTQNISFIVMYRYKFYQFVIIIKYVFKMKFCKPKKHYIPVKFHCTVDTKPKGKKQTKKKTKSIRWFIIL